MTTKEETLFDGDYHEEPMLIQKHQERIDRLEKIVRLMEEQIKQLNRDMFFLKGQHGKC